jgi:hypothetical protein
MVVWADPMQVITQARDGGYAVGGFNMHNDETTQALVQAAERAQAPVFLQVGRAIVPHMGLRRAYELTRRVAEESDAEVIIHLDHGPWDEVFEAIKLGFQSIMYDGAHLPFEENIRTTRHVVQVAHSFGIPVEAELGKIPDADEVVDWASYYTDVKEAERFVAEYRRRHARHLGRDRARRATVRPAGRSRSSAPRRSRRPRAFRWCCTARPGFRTMRYVRGDRGRRAQVSTPTPIYGMRSGPGSRTSGPAGTGSSRRRWPRAGRG